MKKATTPSDSSPSRIRCAIYTRKSTEDGLDQEFNSLDAQRESAESYIASQKGAGWVCLRDRYDDGGYSGGNAERPALKQLMTDIEAGRVDCVVVYKVDRLSRSLTDFCKIIEVFEKYKVSFVSVTQHFNTTNSMGRLTLNILLSFAQFEREIIGERIRDKIAAQRRKGKWSGGAPLLGYDVDRSGPSPKLIVNVNEAARVRAIFDLYLEKGSLLPAVTELNRRGWRTKTLRSAKGHVRGDRPFDRATLYMLLTNPILIGKIRHKTEVYEGEHEGIVSPKVFARVQQMLEYNGRNGSHEVRNRHGALLRKILRCKACDRTMVHSFSRGRSNSHVYRYYICTHAIKSGRGTCPSGSLPASEIEKVVLDQIRGIASDPRLLKSVAEEATCGIDGQIAEINSERAMLNRQLGRDRTEVQRLARGAVDDVNILARAAELQERVQQAERRLSDLSIKADELEADRISDREVSEAVADFDSLWNRLSPRERARLITLLISKVEYDADEGSVSVTFHPGGFRVLAEQSEAA